MRHVLTPLRHHGCDERLCPVPLSPQALAQLYARYLELKNSGRLPEAMTFEQFFWVWRS
jgi:immune inhibitor A